MKNNLLFLLSLFFSIPVIAQDNSFGKVTLTSREAAAIITYHNYPVDYAFGVPDIEVPLFEINTRVKKSS